MVSKHLAMHFSICHIKACAFPQADVVRKSDGLLSSVLALVQELLSSVVMQHLHCRQKCSSLSLKKMWGAWVTGWPHSRVSSYRSGGLLIVMPAICHCLQPLGCGENLMLLFPLSSRIERKWPVPTPFPIVCRDPGPTMSPFGLASGSLGWSVVSPLLCINSVSCLPRGHLQDLL